jgi:dTDP-4-amino-4,6-dideoxygalactose transaminase
VRLVDLGAQQSEIAEEVAEGFARVLATSSFILGGEVAAFEEEFARYSGVGHCVGVANGTDALELALRALGIGPGDEVVLPANTFIATALAVSRAGAVPVLVDSDPAYHLIDPACVAARLGHRTRAVIVVHLFGQVGPVKDLKYLTEKNGIVLVEDAAQAQGARQEGTAAGAFGLAAGTSFYPGKNLGAYGDAGAVLTRSEALASKLRALRNYGSEHKYHHPEPGFNSRLDTLQAVVLRAKLKRLEGWNAARRAAARRYDALLGDLPEVIRPATVPGNEHIWHLYVVRVHRRDEVLRRMREAGIEAGVHYPVPIHLQGALRDLGHRRGDFPVAEKAAEEILSLPLYPHITAPQQERVVSVLRQALG